MAQQSRSWEFDLEEGILDPGGSRASFDPRQPLSFKREKDTEFRDTVVTLLIDNSGSCASPDHRCSDLRDFGPHAGALRRQVKFLVLRPAPGRAANRARPGCRKISQLRPAI